RVWGQEELGRIEIAVRVEFCVHRHTPSQTGPPQVERLYREPALTKVGNRVRPESPRSSISPRRTSSLMSIFNASLYISLARLSTDAAAMASIGSEGEAVIMSRPETPIRIRI